MKTIRLTAVALFLMLGVTIFAPAPVAYAAQNDQCHQSSGFLGMPTWYEYLEVGDKGGDPCAIIGPTADGKFSLELALPRIGLAVIDILLRVAGMVAVAFVIASGFRYMTSQGEPENVKKAQSSATNALIGLAIALLASSIVGFVGSRLW